MGLVKEHADRGPTKCRTYIDDDLIIVLMRGGFSRLENTLFEDGKWLDVRSMRHAFQDTTQGRFTETIERLTGREVAAFMSASHQHPDVQIEASCATAAPPAQNPPDQGRRVGAAQTSRRVCGDRLMLRQTDLPAA